MTRELVLNFDSLVDNAKIELILTMLKKTMYLSAPSISLVGITGSVYALGNEEPFTFSTTLGYENVPIINVLGSLAQLGANPDAFEGDDNIWLFKIDFNNYNLSKPNITLFEESGIYQFDYKIDMPRGGVLTNKAFGDLFSSDREIKLFSVDEDTTLNFTFFFRKKLEDSPIKATDEENLYLLPKKNRVNPITIPCNLIAVFNMGYSDIIEEATGKSVKIVVRSNTLKLERLQQYMTDGLNQVKRAIDSLVDVCDQTQEN